MMGWHVNKKTGESYYRGRRYSGRFYTLTQSDFDRMSKDAMFLKYLLVGTFSFFFSFLMLVVCYVSHFS